MKTRFAFAITAAVAVLGAAFTMSATPAAAQMRTIPFHSDGNPAVEQAQYYGHPHAVPRHVPPPAYYGHGPVVRHGYPPRPWRWRHRHHHWGPPAYYYGRGW